MVVVKVLILQPQELNYIPLTEQYQVFMVEDMLQVLQTQLQLIKEEQP